EEPSDQPADQAADNATHHSTDDGHRNSGTDGGTPRGTHRCTAECARDLETTGHRSAFRGFGLMFGLAELRMAHERFVVLVRPRTVQRDTRTERTKALGSELCPRWRCWDSTELGGTHVRRLGWRNRRGWEQESCARVHTVRALLECFFRPGIERRGRVDEG